MVMRLWRGFAHAGAADAYEAMLKPELLPGIGKAKGYERSWLLRREAETETEFVTMMLWDSLDAIRALAGPEAETAIVPAERRQHLARYDAKSSHYLVAATHRATAVEPPPRWRWRPACAIHGPRRMSARGDDMSEPEPQSLVPTETAGPPRRRRRSEAVGNPRLPADARDAQLRRREAGADLARGQARLSDPRRHPDHAARRSAAAGGLR